MHQAITGSRQLRAQRDRRLTHHQGGNHRRQHQHAEQHVGAGPGAMQITEAGRAETLGKEQRASGGQQRGDPITGHVAGSEGGLALIVGDFQAVGVDGDILGGRGKGDQHSQGNQPGQVFLRITKAHADESHYHQNLRQHQP
ncbi:hypothetical protein D3C80_1028490 [compost metagenome]